jgi:hypothetical protein
VASTFDCRGQFTLVAGAGSRLAAWPDLAIFSYEPSEHIGSFVVDDNILVCTELTDFWPGNISTAYWLLGFNG